MILDIAFHNVVENVPQNVPQKSDIEIIKELIKENLITRQEMAKKIGKTVKTVSRLLSNTTYIIYIGPSKGGHWKIKQ